MQSIWLLIMFLSLLASSLQTQGCFSAVCLAGSSTCTDGWCQCLSGSIFDCTTPATYITVGSNNLNIAAGQQFFILDSSIDSQLEYYFLFRDQKYLNLLDNYQISIVIDQGVGNSFGSSGAYGWTSISILQAKLQIKLGYVSGTSIPQQLILNITATSSSVMAVSYSYQANKWSSILLILGYVAGGILLIATIVMIVVIVKRNRREAELIRQRQQGQENSKNDIAHFEEFMPVGSITVKDIKDGRTCAVCLQELDFNSTIRTTVCSHIFHQSCLDEWALKNLSCPICRTSLTRENIIEMRQQQQRKDNSSWVVNTIDFSDDEGEQPRKPKETLSANNNQEANLIEQSGQSGRSLRQPLYTEDLGNDQL